MRLITHLETFKGRSQLMTWAYTVAVRQLMRTRKRQIEFSVIGAEKFAAFLDQGLADRDFTAEEAEYRLLCAEVRSSCTEELRARQRESGYADHRAALDELIAGAALLAAPALIIYAPRISGQTKRVPVSTSDEACATTSVALVSWVVMPPAATTRHRPPL